MTQTPNKLEEQWEKEERTNRFLKKLVLYGSSALLVLGLGSLGGYFSREREVTKSRQEISQLESKLEEQKTTNEATINYASSLSDSLYLRNVAIDSLNAEWDKSESEYKLAYEAEHNLREELREELEFYTDEVKLNNMEYGRLTTLISNANAEKEALQDSVNTLNTTIDDLNLRLAEADSTLINYRRREEADKPQVIKLPGDISTRFNYYLKNGNNAGGLTLSKSLGQSNIIDTAIEGGFNVFEGRDTGQFLGFRLSLDLLERFSWDFGMGPYILKDFSDGAKATLTLYGESGFYFEPFGKVKGLGLRVGVRKLEDRFDYSTALELGRN